jgi:hypothetical protein
MYVTGGSVTAACQLHSEVFQREYRVDCMIYCYNVSI